PALTESRMQTMRPAPVPLLCLLSGVLSLSASASSPREMTTEARRLMDGGDLTGAVKMMQAARRAMQAEPVLDRALAEALAGQLYNAGVKLNNGAHPSEAISAFEEALQLDRDARGVRDAAFRATLRDATLQVARYLVASGHPSDAVTACRLLTERTPPEPGA